MITKKHGLTAVDFLDFDLFPVKGETPKCLPTLMLKCWHVLL